MKGYFKIKSFLTIIILAAAAIGLFLGPFFPNSALAMERLACASYPVFLFTRYLAEGRERFNVELITSPASGCPHEFAPTPRDLERLTQTSVLVKNGLNLEPFLDKAAKVLPPQAKVIDASQSIPTLSMVWGRLDFDSSQKPFPDGTLPSMIPNPHAFLSPKFAKIMAANIVSGLSQLDPSGADYYAQRLSAFNADMENLEREIELFRLTHRGYRAVTSHGFFDYLAQDLGLAVLADINPSESVPPSAARLKALAELIKIQKISVILVDPHADPNPAKALSRECGVPAAIIDTATSGPAEPPIDFYQQIIREDMALLSKILPQTHEAPPDSPTKTSSLSPPTGLK
ncbi:MAG: metal ABC transporter substrate-binding protein [Deltaproteobacteria bacterium]|jgi:zinc/manganese transport system substrate-binding protein/zinc transport system substrate-binding protein|nr:metal ABC transporter substrate-binding protein [Deltaproteobacteria bacterium]